MGTVIALASVSLTAVGLIVAVLSFTRRLRDGEIDAAEKRGRMEQRVDEVERDVDHIGASVRELRTEQSDVRQVLVKIESGQEYIIKSLDQLRKDQKEHEAQATQKASG